MFAQIAWITPKRVKYKQYFQKADKSEVACCSGRLGSVQNIHMQTVDNIIGRLHEAQSYRSDMRSPRGTSDETVLIIIEN